MVIIIGIKKQWNNNKWIANGIVEKVGKDVGIAKKVKRVVVRKRCQKKEECHVPSA